MMIAWSLRNGNFERLKTLLAFYNIKYALEEVTKGWVLILNADGLKIEAFRGVENEIQDFDPVLLTTNQVLDLKLG